MGRVSLDFLRLIYFGISYYLIPAIANKRRINALSVRLVGFISSHQLTDRKPLVWPLSVVFRCLPTDRIYFCLDNRVLCVGITLLFAPSASISHRLSYLQSWTRSQVGLRRKRVFVGFCDSPSKSAYNASALHWLNKIGLVVFVLLWCLVPVFWVGL